MIQRPRRAHIRQLADASSIHDSPPLVKAFTIECLIMYTVYVLYSESFDKIYIGFTNNLENRFKSHNELGKKGWTIKFRPWVIIHTENFESKASALKREKQLKSAMGRVFIRELIHTKFPNV